MTNPSFRPSDYDFDFQARKAQLESLVVKWATRPPGERLSTRLGAISLTLRDAAFQLVDEGHPPGEETIKRNFDLAELIGHVLARFTLAGYCIGVEYGTTRLQRMPVNDPQMIPNEVKEMFVVSLKPIEELCLRLIADVHDPRGSDAAYVASRHESFNATAFGVLITSYRLGVATAMERAG